MADRLVTDAPGAPGAGRARWLPALGLVAQVVFWAGYVWVDWARQGLFFHLGVDWSRFWGSARAFAADGPVQAYHLDAIARAMAPLAAFYRDGLGPVKVGPIPYPPAFVALVVPFTWPRPTLGFLLWSGLNLALAAYVARGLARRFPRARRRRVAALLVTCFPLAMGIFVGQPTGLLVLALYQSYLAFERGDEGRAGLWAGLLFVKPQYVTGPLLVLLSKRRWRALAGAAAAEAAILAGSLVVGGLGGIAGYLRTFVEDYPAYRGGIAIDPTGMINWRGLLTTLFPRLPADAGLAATALLSLATLALLPLVWRGRWDPRSPLFAPRFLATMMVTLLIAYHSQLHGAALLAIPGAIALASQSAPRLVRAVLLAGLFGSPVVATLSGLLIGNPMLVAPSYVAAMAVALGAIVWAERGQPTGEAAVALEAGRFAAAPAVARRPWSDRGPGPGGPSR